MEHIVWIFSCLGIFEIKRLMKLSSLLYCKYKLCVKSWPDGRESDSSGSNYRWGE